MLHIWHTLLTFKMFDVAIYVFVSLFFFHLRIFQISMMQFDCPSFSPTCISQVGFFSQHNFLYSKHHTYDKILRFTIFFIVIFSIKTSKENYKKNGCWPFWHYYRHFGQYQFMVCLYLWFFFFIHALLKKQIKNFAELNYCDFYFIVFPFDALENKLKKNFVIFRSPE